MAVEQSDIWTQEIKGEKKKKITHSKRVWTENRNQQKWPISCSLDFVFEYGIVVMYCVALRSIKNYLIKHWSDSKQIWCKLIHWIIVIHSYWNQQQISSITRYTSQCIVVIYVCTAINFVRHFDICFREIRDFFCLFQFEWLLTFDNSHSLCVGLNIG